MFNVLPFVSYLTSFFEERLNRFYTPLSTLIILAGLCLGIIFGQPEAWSFDYPVLAFGPRTFAEQAFGIFVLILLFVYPLVPGTQKKSGLLAVVALPLLTTSFSPSLVLGYLLLDALLLDRSAARSVFLVVLALLAKNSQSIFEDWSGCLEVAYTLGVGAYCFGSTLNLDKQNYSRLFSFVLSLALLITALEGFFEGAFFHVVAAAAVLTLFFIAAVLGSREKLPLLAAGFFTTLFLGIPNLGLVWIYFAAFFTFLVVSQNPIKNQQNEKKELTLFEYLLPHLGLFGLLALMTTLCSKLDPILGWFFLVIAFALYPKLRNFTQELSVLKNSKSVGAISALLFVLAAGNFYLEWFGRI